MRKCEECGGDWVICETKPDRCLDNQITHLEARLAEVERAAEAVEWCRQHNPCVRFFVAGTVEVFWPFTASARAEAPTLAEAVEQLKAKLAEAQEAKDE